MIEKKASSKYSVYFLIVIILVFIIYTIFELSSFLLNIGEIDKNIQYIGEGYNSGPGIPITSKVYFVSYTKSVLDVNFNAFDYLNSGKTYEVSIFASLDNLNKNDFYDIQYLKLTKKIIKITESDSDKIVFSNTFSCICDLGVGILFLLLLYFAIKKIKDETNSNQINNSKSIDLEREAEITRSINKTATVIMAIMITFVSLILLLILFFMIFLS